VQALLAKVQYSCPEKYGSVIAPWFNQINTFLFGGLPSTASSSATSAPT
jgi:hypothetical protein